MVEIETYEIEECAKENRADFDAEAIALIEEMGLDGQKSLIHDPEDDGALVRIPYPRMTAQEKRVYETIFPEKPLVSEYSAGILPVRVLQVARHAQDMFTCVRVWHRKVQDPDPILVGHTSNSTYSGEEYLLARWGDGLRHFKELLQEAREIVIAKWKSQLARKATEVEGFNPELHVDQHLSGEYVSTPF